jgi:probable rRNA maturation factor
MPVTVHVQYGCARQGVPSPASFQRWAEAALAGRREAAELAVRVVGEAEGADLNARYRGEAGPTNVLSFPFEAPPGVRLDHLGDLVICAPVVSAEARAQGKPAPAHWAHLVVHGILHLLGHDHDNPRTAAEMEGLEVQVLARLGIPDPYGDRDLP